MQKILFFSNNFSKQKEVKKVFKKYDIKILSPKDYNTTIQPKEIGNTFDENAKIKSKYGYNLSGLSCFADDSGISIEALNWRPNIFSRKFFDSFNNKKECFNFIVNKVKKSGKNRAYFQTSICYTIDHKYHINFQGKLEGTISEKILGDNGFGYDPIFIPNGHVKTLGEIGIKEKNLISHRAIAINKLVNFLIS